MNNPRPIVLGSYSPSQNGIIVSPHGIALCIAGGGYSTALSARYDGWAGLYDEHGQHTIVLIEYD